MHVSSVRWTDSTDELIGEGSAADTRRWELRLSFVPEDRLGMGLVGNMDLIRQHDAEIFPKGKIDIHG